MASMKDDRKLLVLVEHLKNYACLVFLATYSAHLRFINGEEKKVSINFGAVVFFCSFFAQKTTACRQPSTQAIFVPPAVILIQPEEARAPLFRPTFSGSCTFCSNTKYSSESN